MPQDKHGHDRDDTPHYDQASGGWGSMRGIARILRDQKPSVGAVRTLWRQNKPGGHMCTSCAWGKPKVPHPFEFCENGAKATIWDLRLTAARPISLPRIR